jgi:ribulose-5-phosphate 4-epimerase/fuculose-1-phosphate aldolase
MMSLIMLQQNAARLAHDSAIFPDWVQASGGNVSVKDEAADILVIKASGTRFSNVTAHHGLVGVRLSGVRALLDDPQFEGLSFIQQQDHMGSLLGSWVLPECQGRPSLETGFHSLGPSVVLHTHPIAVLALVCQRQGPAMMTEAMQGLPAEAVWVARRPPGFSLALEVRKALQAQPKARVVWMENHGLAVFGDTVESVLELNRACIQRCLEIFGQPAAPEVFGSAEVLEKVRDRLRHFLTRDLKAAHAHTALASSPYAKALASGGAWAWQPLLADDVLFCGYRVPLLSAEQAMDHACLQAHFADAPQRLAVAVEGHGVVMAAAHETALEYMHEMLHTNSLARAMARTRGALKPLDDETCRLIAGMEGERFRQRLAG